MSSWTLHKEGLKCTAVSKYLILKTNPSFFIFFFWISSLTDNLVKKVISSMEIKKLSNLA